MDADRFQRVLQRVDAIHRHSGSRWRMTHDVGSQTIRLEDGLERMVAIKLTNPSLTHREIRSDDELATDVYAKLSELRRGTYGI